MNEDTAVIRAVGGRYEGAVPEDVLLLPVPEDMEEARRILDTTHVRSLFRFMDVHRARHRDGDIGLAGPVLGAPQAVILLENLVAMGARRIVCFGWCGSIREHVRIGDLVLPVRAISDEGTSRHYPVPGRKAGADEGLLRTLLARMDQEGIAVHQGAVWTTDAPYRETLEKVARMGQRGAIAVEMELSALFKASAFRKVRLAALVVVSDELFTGTWKHGFKDERFRRRRTQGLRVAMDACAAADAWACGSPETA